MPRLRAAVARRNLPVVLAAAVATFLAVVPVGYLLWGAFFDDRGLTLVHFRDAYRTFGIASMAVSSIGFALASTAVAIVVGGALAFVVVRTDAPLRRTIAVLALVPLVIPGVLYTFAWILIGSPRVGLLSHLPPPLGFDCFSFGGMVLVQGLHVMPIAFLLIAAALRSFDPAFEEAALTSGARPLTVIRRITLPLAAPAFYAAALLTAVASLEAFEVPVMLGIPSGNWVLSSRIWSAFSQTPAQLGQAGAYSCSLLVVTLAGVLAYRHLTRRRGRFETVTGGGARPYRYRLRGRRGAAAALAAAGTVAVSSLLPLAALAYCSLQGVYTTPTVAGLSRLTLVHYRDALGGASLHAFANSLLLGAGAATFVMLLTSIVAWSVVRRATRAAAAVDAVTTLPLAVPGLVLATSLLFIYLHWPVGVYGTFWILLIAYVTRFMPLGVRFAGGALRRVSGDLEDAARVSGAGWWQTFRRVDLPLLAPGLVAGWILVLILSMRELATSILLYSPGQEVVPVRIWQQFEEGEFPAPAATGILLVLVIVAIAATGWLLATRTARGRLMFG